jgi:hypothetical protein
VTSTWVTGGSRLTAADLQLGGERREQQPAGLRPPPQRHDDPVIWVGWNSPTSTSTSLLTSKPPTLTRSVRDSVSASTAESSVACCRTACAFSASRRLTVSKRTLTYA